MFSARSGRNLLLGFAVERRDLYIRFVWHHEVLLLLLDNARFNFTVDHGAHVAVFGGDGHHEGCVDFAFERLH